jgi:hypothetical protein
MHPSQCIDARSRRLNRLNFHCAHLARASLRRRGPKAEPYAIVAAVHGRDDAGPLISASLRPRADCQFVISAFVVEFSEYRGDVIDGIVRSQVRSPSQPALPLGPGQVGRAAPARSRAT